MWTLQSDPDCFCFSVLSLSTASLQTSKTLIQQNTRQPMFSSLTVSIYTRRLVSSSLFLFLNTLSVLQTSFHVYSFSVLFLFVSFLCLKARVFREACCVLKCSQFPPSSLLMIFKLMFFFKASTVSKRNDVIMCKNGVSLLKFSVYILISDVVLFKNHSLKQLEAAVINEHDLIKSMALPWSHSKCLSHKCFCNVRWCSRNSLLLHPVNWRIVLFMRKS